MSKTKHDSFSAAAVKSAKEAKKLVKRAGLTAEQALIVVDGHVNPAAIQLLRGRRRAPTQH